MRDQANVSDIECWYGYDYCDDPECPKCGAGNIRKLLYGTPVFEWNPPYKPIVPGEIHESVRLPATAQMALATDNRKYDTLRVQRGKVMEIFDFLGRVQGTLFRLQDLHLGNKEEQRVLQNDIARSIQRLHLIVEYLTKEN